MIRTINKISQELRAKATELVRASLKQAILTSLSLNWLRYLGHDTP